MWYKLKISRNVLLLNNNKEKEISEVYLTEAPNFAEAGYRVLKLLGNKIEVEDIMLLKQFKPAVNEYTDGNKIYIVKVAEDVVQDDGLTKTIKYSMPVFANNDNELYTMMKDFLKQGLTNMRVATISETKWIYLKEQK